MRYPDEYLPNYQMSLARFVRTAQRLLSPPEDVDAFVRFVLAGRLVVDGVLHRVTVNARQDATQLDQGTYQIRRDLDSTIGITQDLPFTEAMSVFPIASFKDTLKRDNHVKGRIPMDNVSGQFHPIFCTLTLCYRVVR
jgi:hypothetical protein